MGLTLVFSELHVLLSHLWEKEKKKNEKRKEGKRNRKGKEGKKEGRRNKKRKKDKMEEGIKKRSLLLALNRSG